MSDLLKAALGSATIIAFGLYLAADRLAAPRYAVAAAGNGATAWKLDRNTGKVSFCVMGGGCQPMESIGPAGTASSSAQPDEWLEQWKNSQATNSN